MNYKFIMKVYKLIVIWFYSLIRIIIIKAVWVEVPQFSNNEKVYRTSSFKLNRLHQFSRNESGAKFITHPAAQSNFQRIDKFKNVSEVEKTVCEKGLEHSNVNDTTCATTALPIKFSTGSFQKTDTVTSIPLYKNFEKNQTSFQNYNEKNNAEDNASDKQLTTISNVEKDELYTTCTTDIFETKKHSNLSIPNLHSEQQYFNRSKNDADNRFLYYLPITLFRRVHFILKAQPHTLTGKIKFLRNFEKILLSEVESRLAATILPYTDIKKSKRKRRYDHHEEDSLGFPSLEGALMAISFLAFAVYLVRLIMLLFQNFNSTSGSPAIFLGRRRRSMNHFNDEMERILGYLDKQL